MMDYRRAYELYLANRDKYAGMPPAQAVSQIQRSGGMEAYAPQGAIPAAIPVPQGAIAAAMQAPQPQVEAAPVAEGEVVAEQPPAPRPYRGAYAQALEAFNAENPVVEQQAPPKGGKVDFVAMNKQRLVEDQRADLMAKARLEEQAVVDPELQKIYDTRLERTTQQLENIDKDRNQAVWMAIAQAGMKMAQSQSPYFMQALASGLESGLNGYDEVKAKAAEKKARLEAMKEDLAIETINAKRQAAAEAVSRYDSSIQNVAARQALEKSGLQNIILGETAGEEIAGSKLANDVRRAQIAQIYSNIENDKARLALARTAAGRGRGGPSAGTRSRAAALASASKWAVGEAEKALEAEGITRDDPAYGQRLAATASRYRNIYYATNPMAAAAIGVDPTKIKLNFEEPAPKKQEKKSWLSFINPFD